MEEKRVKKKIVKGVKDPKHISHRQTRTDKEKTTSPSTDTSEN